MDIRQEIGIHTKQVEEIIIKYLPKEEELQEMILEIFYEKSEGK